MQIKVESPHINIRPDLLDSGYNAGAVLFDPIELTALTRPKYTCAILRQLGIFWNIADAPNITIYIFAAKPEGWGAAGATPAPTFDTRAALVGEWSVDGRAPYSTMPGDDGDAYAYALATGLLAVLSVTNQRGWITATIDEAYTGDLTDALQLTLNVDKNSRGTP